MKKLVLIQYILLTFVFCACNKEVDVNNSTPRLNVEAEKEAILKTLNNETKAAFQRDFDLWTEYWIHDADISKTYMNFTDNSYSESIGWKKISAFVQDFINEHPEPEPVPELLDKIDVRLYKDGAWVSFEQLDSIRGLKRETRLMEKVNGNWKIAGMHTSIYGFKNDPKN